MIGFLYGQTEYNILQNAIHLDEYVSYAKKNGYSFLSITDSNLYGHYKFYEECLKNGIKPIIGLEIKYKDLFVLAYCVNNEGYTNLLHLSTVNEIRSLITIEDLEKYNKGIVYIVKFNDNKVIDTINDFTNRIKYGIGIDLANHKNEALELRDYAYQNSIKIYPLSQTLYLTPYDKVVYDCLMRIGNNNNALYGDYYFPLLDELKDRFKEYQVFENLEELVDNINVTLETRKILLPSYPLTNGMPSKEYLKALCYKGITKRLENSKHPLTNYQERLDYELSVIDRMGYNDYFLIVWDFIKYAKKEGIMVGPGRGSAAGSLVAYSLGITNVDPLRFDLLFERFLNPERVSMPDIDNDFPDDKRDLVIDHVKELYGEKHVCNISAFGTFQIKSSLRDLGKIFNIKQDRLDVIIKMILETNNYDDLLTEYKDNEDIYNLLYTAKKIENLPRHISTHAAGIILSNDELGNIIPLQKGLNGLFQSQLEASDLEHMGLLKIDFLGIRNLSIIDNICHEIKGLDNMTINKIPLNDKKTFNLLSNADTLGIFQLESEGIKRVLLKLSPECFEDIVAVLALYRPGPMDNIDEYILRRHGKEFTYLDPDLEEILKSTYGFIVYQEQIMRIAQKFAGYSLGEADILRRAVSKKNEKTLLSLSEDFISRSIKKGYKEQTAHEIYDYIVKFANYGFNRSHSVAYAMVSYQMAYLKANYFHIFMQEILNNVISSKDTTKEYIEYASRHGVKVFPPNINYSMTRFIKGNKGLLFPLLGIANIGNSLANEIIQERQNGFFISFSDFKKRVKGANKQAIESLIYSGAFDCFNMSKKAMLERAEAKYDLIDDYLTDRIFENTELDLEVLKTEEKRVLGLNLKYNIFKELDKLIEKHKSHMIAALKRNTNVKVIGCFMNIKEILTKKDEIMLVGEFNDSMNNIDIVIFPEAFSSLKGYICMNNLFIVEGKCDINTKSSKLQIQIKKATKI